MSYNPVSNTTAATIKAEAAAYGVLYLEQGKKHVRYSWILWAGLLVLFSLLACLRILHCVPPLRRRLDVVATWWKRTTVFGRDIKTSRLSASIILIYVLYNVVFAFVDIPYGRSFRYTSKHAPGLVQTATTMQFIANRTGYLAFASVPLIFLMVARNNVVTLITGYSYTGFQLFHRWAGWAVFMLTWIHTLLWTIEMGVHYKMEGGYLATRWRKRYWVGGFFATLFLCYLIAHSLAPIRRLSGYEFFRISHNFGSVLFIIGCWVHWPEACQWIAAALAIYFSDRLFRWSTIIIHYVRARGKTEAYGSVFDDEDDVNVATLEIKNTGLKSWTAGQHVYIYCFSIGDWEPHPFSVANCGRGGDTLKLVVLQKKGMTAELIDHLCLSKKPLKVMIDGPYGSSSKQFLRKRNLLLIAGGTGISFALSALYAKAAMPSTDHQIKLIWFVRRNANVEWIIDDLRQIKSVLQDRLNISVIVTREDARQSIVLKNLGGSDPKKDWNSYEGSDPSVGITQHSSESNMIKLVQDFAELQPDVPLSVLASGPGAMGHDVEYAIEALRRYSRGDIVSHIETFST